MFRVCLIIHAFVTSIDNLKDMFTFAYVTMTFYVVTFIARASLLHALASYVPI